MLKDKKLVKRVVKIAIIVIAAIALSAGGTWLAVNRVVRPPEVPDIPVVIAPLDLPVAVESYANDYTINDESEYEPENDYDDELPPPQLMQLEERRPSFFTFLILGLTEGNHANTIMVAAYDAETRQGYIISIPRDTRVDFHRTRRKIVNAYPVGYLGGRGHDGGIERMRHEVSTLIGFKPDFYISVDYEAFVRMVDAVGGVELNVPFHMLYDDPRQNLHINISAGVQVLDGQNALHFSRYRLGNNRRQTISDYQRIEHQQQVLAAVVRELLTPASILKIPEFSGIFIEYVNSNLAIGELTWFANQFRHIGGLEALNFYTLPTRGTSGAPYWYELADEAGILELVNRTVNPLVRNITASDLRIVR